MRNIKIKDNLKRKKAIKRVCSALIAGCMLICSIGTFAVEGEAAPSYDYEQDFSTDLGGSSGSIFFDPSIAEAERIVIGGDNGVLKVPAQAELASAGAMGFRPSVASRNYIFSFEFYPKQANTKFMFQAKDNGNKSFMFFSAGSNGKAGFAKYGGWSESNPNNDSFFAADYNVNEWNRVAVKVDTSTQVLTYYINGVELGSQKPSSSNVSTAVISYISFFTGMGDISGEIYYDNFKLYYGNEIIADNNDNDNNNDDNNNDDNNNDDNNNDDDNNDDDNNDDDNNDGDNDSDNDNDSNDDNNNNENNGNVSESTDDLSDDFAQNFNVDLGASTGEIYFDASVSDAERVALNDGNGVLKIPSRTEIASAGAMAFRSEIENKKYMLSFDFYAKQTDTKFMFQARDTANKAFLVFTIGANGKVGFAKNGGWVESNPNSDFFATDYNANEWNHVDVIVKTSTHEMEYFINGVSLGSKIPNGNVETAVISHISFFTGVGTASSEVYFDNFRLNYVTGGTFCAGALGSGETVTAIFSETPENSAANEALLKSVKLYNAATGEQIIPEAVSFENGSLLIDAALADGQYTLIFADGVKAITGNTLANRCVTFFSGAPATAYVKAAVMRDFSGVEYIPFDNIPVTQDYIKVKLSGEGVNISSANIALVDEDDDACVLGVASVFEGGIKVPVSEFLNAGKEYTLTISGLTTTDGIALPAYTAKFNTTRDNVSDGFAEVDIVLADGSTVSDVTAMDEVFVSTKYINATGTLENAVIAVAAYSVEFETDAQTSAVKKALKLLDIETELVDLTSRLTAIGPDGVVISLNVPSGTDVLKAFIWNGDAVSTPLVSAVVKPEYTADAISGEVGAKQTGSGEITANIEGLGNNAEVSVSVAVKGSGFGDEVIYADQVVTDEKGKMGIRFNVGDIISKEYTITVIDATGNKKAFDVAYVKDSEYTVAADALDMAILNNSDEALAITAVKGVLEANYEKFGIGSELYGCVDTQQAAKLLYNEIKTASMDSDRTDGTSLVKKAFLVAAVANGSLENLFDYDEELELDNDLNYEWYSKDYVKDDVQKSITSRQNGSYSTLAEFFSKMEESFILSVVQYPDGVGNLREVLQNADFAVKVGILATAKDSTYLGLVGKNFGSLTALKTEFDILENTPQNPGGAGGGGAGGGGGATGGTTQNVTFTGESTTDTQPSTIPLEIFNDIADYEWAKQAIVYLAEREIVSGKEKTKFCPGDKVTREEMATMLVRAFVKDEEGKDISFTDAKDNAWYVDYLKKAVGAGIVQGYDDGRFGVGEYITRQDMVVMITRAMAYAGIVLETQSDGNLFVDDSAIADYAKNAVYELKQAGIVNGVTVDSFAPTENANRAQAAKVIFALLNI